MASFHGRNGHSGQSGQRRVRLYINYINYSYNYWSEAHVKSEEKAAIKKSQRSTREAGLRREASRWPRGRAAGAWLSDSRHDIWEAARPTLLLATALPKICLLFLSVLRALCSLRRAASGCASPCGAEGGLLKRWNNADQGGMAVALTWWRRVAIQGTC